MFDEATAYPEIRWGQVKGEGKRACVAPSVWTTPFGVVWLLSVSALCAWSTGALRMDPVEVSAVSEDGVREEVEASGFRPVDTAEMRALVDTGSHLILDARPRGSFAEAHIPGAMSLPIGDFEGTLPEVAPMLMSGMPMVLYCTGPLCDDALRLARRLEEAGFPDAAVYVEGMEGWTEEGAP